MSILKLEQHLRTYAHPHVNAEWLDGFFAALVSAPTLIPPSVYMDKIRNDVAFPDVGEAQAVMSALMDHWNDVVRRFEHQEVFPPLLMDDETAGQSWAAGYFEAITLCPFDWDPLFHDGKDGPLLVPVMALKQWGDSGEWDDEIELDAILDMLGPSVSVIQRRFQRERAAKPAPVRREAGKIGRNEPCPCGSGKKYKKCCGLH